MNQSDICQRIKTVTIGQQFAGKTSLIERYYSGHFKQIQYGCTLCELLEKTIQRFGKNYKIQFWDTAGQERYISLSKSYYKNSKCITLVYDITNRKSFERIQEFYLSTFVNQPQDNIIYILVGNKQDNEEERQVQFREGEELAKSYGFNFLETSAKTGYNVNNMYNLLLDQYLQVN